MMLKEGWENVNADGYYCTLWVCQAGQLRSTSWYARYQVRLLPDGFIDNSKAKMIPSGSCHVYIYVWVSFQGYGTTHFSKGVLGALLFYDMLERCTFGDRNA